MFLILIEVRSPRVTQNNLLTNCTAADCIGIHRPGTGTLLALMYVVMWLGEQDVDCVFCKVYVTQACMHT